MKTFAVGDIHGRWEALKQVLEKSKFDYASDKLIVLGDIVDGGYRTYEVVEELLKINNVVFVIGNHDEWWMNHMSSGWAEEIWIQQGGANTLKSYGASVKEADRITDNSLIDTSNLRIPVTHQDFFNRAVYYHVEEGMLFVHGGYNIKLGVENTKKFDLVWDRELIKFAKTNKIPEWKKVFVGHTTTQLINGMTEPIQYNNLFCLDTGAGWNGKLCIMDVHTNQFWLSDIQKPAVR